MSARDTEIMLGDLQYALGSLKNTRWADLLGNVLYELYRPVASGQSVGDGVKLKLSPAQITAITIANAMGLFPVGGVAERLAMQFESKFTSPLPGQLENSD